MVNTRRRFRFTIGQGMTDQDSPAIALDSKRAKTQAELELVEHLLRRTHEGDDEIVISKLSEYRASLERELQL